jgi:hypothetical protein
MTTTQQPTASNYHLTASNGRHIRTATMVTFPDGRVVRFMEKMSKRDAIKQATR